MRHDKAVSGFVDFYVGKFPVVFSISALLIIFMSFPAYDGGVVHDYIISSYKLLGVVDQFNVVVEGRANPDRSMALILGGVLINAAAFVFFLWVIPASHLRETYLRNNCLSSYLRLALSCSFFLMVLVVGLYKTFDVESRSGPRGRFAEIILPLVQKDVGLGLLFLVLLMVTVYCFAITLKTIFVHIRTV